MSRRRTRGFALIHVVVTIIFIGAAALVWRASFQAVHARGVRGHDRARARAVAQAAWERARAALAAGRDAETNDAATLDGAATVTVEPAAGPQARRRVVIEARVARRDGEPVRTLLVLDVEVAPGDVRVRARSEGGA